MHIELPPQQMQYSSQRAQYTLEMYRSSVLFSKNHIKSDITYVLTLLQTRFHNFREENHIYRKSDVCQIKVWEEYDQMHSTYSLV